MLWACGYITLKQLLLIYLALIAGIILSAIAPAISSIYTVPSEWIGLKPAMILFNRFTLENIEQINSLEENELENAVQTYTSAAEIITKHLSNSSDLLQNYPEIRGILQAIDTGVQYAQRLHDIKSQQREEREEAQRQQRLREEETERQRIESYWQYVREEREKRGLSCGVPPVDGYRCPLQYPIRATDKTKEPGVRGIYYFSDERIGVEVYWCFASPEEAEAEKFRRPRKAPPKRQPR